MFFEGRLPKIEDDAIGGGLKTQPKVLVVPKVGEAGLAGLAGKGTILLWTAFFALLALGYFFFVFETVCLVGGVGIVFLVMDLVLMMFFSLVL